MDLEKEKAKLYGELLRLATSPNVKCRVEKLEEVHKRLNAIIRFQTEVPEMPVGASEQ